MSLWLSPILYQQLPNLPPSVVAILEEIMKRVSPELINEFGRALGYPVKRSRSTMKLHPFYEVAEECQKHIKDGADIYQQFNCAKCGIKQTMDVANTFHKLGKCEECGHITDIEKDGCNYMLTFGVKL